VQERLKVKEKPKSATKNRYRPGWAFRENAFRDASDPSYNNLYVGLRAMPQEPPSQVERRLSAILAADVAGYSRLIHSDEEPTHAKLTALLTDAVNPAIAEHGGRIVKNTGDGFLTEFPSAVEAVRATKRFQTLTHELTSGDTEDRRLRFRVGINIGDAIVEPHDIFGDGVNIAARLESIADARWGLHLVVSLQSGSGEDHARVRRLENAIADYGPAPAPKTQPTAIRPRLTWSVHRFARR
jgi:class 3 adenylate cyclase